MPEYAAILFRSEGGISRVEPATQIVAVSKWLRRGERTTADLVRGLLTEGVPPQFASKVGGVLIRRLQDQGAVRLEQGGDRWIWTPSRKTGE